ESFQLTLRNVSQHLLDGRLADRACCRAGRWKKGVEHALLAVLHPDLAAEAGSGALMYGDRVAGGLVVLTPARREVLVEILAQYGHGAIDHHATQRITKDPFNGLTGILVFLRCSIFCRCVAAFGCGRP